MKYSYRNICSNWELTKFLIEEIGREDFLSIVNTTVTIHFHFLINDIQYFDIYVIQLENQRVGLTQKFCFQTVCLISTMSARQAGDTLTCVRIIHSVFSHQDSSKWISIPPPLYPPWLGSDSQIS